MIFLGRHSIGLPEMKIANLFEDVKILKEVQELALKIIADDPDLKDKKNVKFINLLADKFNSRIEI